MRRQGLRPIAVLLSLLLLTAGPAQASPIRFADVIAQAVATNVGGRQTFDLRLRTLPQNGRATTSDQQTQTPSSGNTSQTPAPSGTGNTSVTNTEVQQPAQGQSGTVETVQLGDVTGTVCDCGEIILPEAHHFPKLPFLALAGIPLLFIPHNKTVTPPETPPTTPTPTPPTPPVPEPTTLLLLGSGLVALGAGARRRRAAQLRQQAELANVGEV
ncbi:MAG: PEP-CTERM sorting domain-containing protein [Pyrinomonadaceae bacterium]